MRPADPVRRDGEWKGDHDRGSSLAPRGGRLDTSQNLNERIRRERHAVDRLQEATAPGLNAAYARAALAAGFSVYGHGSGRERRQFAGCVGRDDVWRRMIGAHSFQRTSSAADCDPMEIEDAIFNARDLPLVIR